MELVCASAGPSRPWAGLRDLPIREAEESLIQSALKGRSDAFGDLVQPYLTPLIRFASARLGCESEAEDIVQQAVLRAFSHLGQFRHEASFKTWLSAIASNEVIHWLPRTSRGSDPVSPRNVRREASESRQLAPRAVPAQGGSRTAASSDYRASEKVPADDPVARPS
jgi:RNA polymerase sigma factor (sigma-70 family)